MIARPGPGFDDSYTLWDLPWGDHCVRTAPPGQHLPLHPRFIIIIVIIINIIIIIIIIIVNDINIIINSTIIISPALMFGSISVLLESATGLVR